ncbi:MAG: ROK family protein [Tannerellaceae bacterium]|jgi:predicted NBD/HSP70 family sugar kinase|nr:ROK family protein [Tannerellaceae bacterium]
METYIGVDLGGTKILIGELDNCGNILKYKKYESAFFNQQSALDIVKESLDDYAGTIGWVNAKPAGMGVGLIGRVDAEQGIWLQIDPKRTQPIPLARELSAHYGIPCFIDNDVKVATRAEQQFGFGQISRNFTYINVGTGIAAGFVVNGQQIRGSHFNAGEVGHTRVGVNLGLKCGCGRTDCVELIASAAGLDLCARTLCKDYETSLQFPAGEGERVSVNEIFSLSRKGDPLCVQLVENASLALANLIMNLVRVTDPDTVVLGGGLVADGYLHTKTLGKLNPTTLRFVTNGVVVTKLNPVFIGLMGAGVIAMNIK